MAKVPLPVRDGLNPTRLVLPAEESAIQRWPTVLLYFLDRFSNDRARLLEKIAAGEVVAQDGTKITPETPFRPRSFVYLYRDPPAEEPDVPQLADLRILHRDEHLLVVDKPHFVAVLPRGRWVQSSALAYLRRELDLPELSPVHRLDRLTAGILVFTIRAEVRGRYQLLFERRQVQKHYQAIAPLSDKVLDFPITVRSRIVKQRGIAAAQNVAGPDNAESLTELVESDPERNLGRYRLTPRTGKTHQLRLHMASLGVPILHDPFAAFWLHGGPITLGDDSGPPLQLLAERLTFDDPITGETREFVSTRTLDAW